MNLKMANIKAYTVNGWIVEASRLRLLELQALQRAESPLYIYHSHIVTATQCSVSLMAILFMPSSACLEAKVCLAIFFV